MIQLVLSAVPIDEVPAKLALATLFEDVRPLKGSTGLIDWRLNGRLSELILKSRMSGEFAESVIMPAQGRLASNEILVFGLGKSSEFNERKIEETFNRIIDKVSLLKSREFIVCFGDLAKDFLSWRALLRSFMDSLSRRIGDRDIEVICAEDRRWVAEAKKRNMDFGPQVTLAYA